MVEPSLGVGNPSTKEGGAGSSPAMSAKILVNELSGLLKAIKRH